MANYSKFYELIGSAIAKENPVWGYHVICCLDDCDKNTINSDTIVKTFVETVIDRIKMVPVGEPILRYFNDGNGRGVSCIQLLTESHVSCHTDDSKMSAYIDVFSCNTYDETKVDTIVATVKEFFNPGHIAVKVILREPGRITNA